MGGGGVKFETENIEFKAQVTDVLYKILGIIDKRKTSRTQNLHLRPSIEVVHAVLAQILRIAQAQCAKVLSCVGHETKG